MIPVLVWLLLVTSNDTHSNRGAASVMERFRTVAQCEHVRSNIPNGEYYVSSKCVQAEILVPK